MAFFFRWQDKTIPQYFNSRYYGGAYPERYIAEPKYFVVEITVNSPKSRVSFQPADVCLESTENSSGCRYPTEWVPPSASEFFAVPRSQLGEMSPIEFLKTWKHGLCNNAITQGRFSVSNNELISQDQLFVPLLKNTMVEIPSRSAMCVVLKFPIATIDPSTKFRLNVGQFKINGKTLLAPIINYAQDSTIHGW